MKTILHVGCGQSARLNFADHDEIRVDANPDANPDIVADFRAIPKEPECCDLVFAKHCLEHIPWPDVLPCLLHWKTLLRSGGKVHVRVPDVEACARGIVYRGLDTVAYVSPAGPVTYRSMLWGHEPLVSDQPGMRHQTGFTAQTLLGALKEAGFSHAEVNIHPDLYELHAEGTKG